MLKDVNKAIYQFEMIQNGDRVAVAVSGGKDSLTLLKLLDWRRANVPEKYEIVAVHISGDSEGPTCPAHPALVEWLESTGYTCVVEAFNLSNTEPIPMNCQRCTWNRRKQLFEIARRMDCNVVALGHNADDLVQTTLMNILFHGKVETMLPVSDYFSGVFRLVRPMIYLSEPEISRFADAAGFPETPPECIRSSTSQRQVVKDFIIETQKKFPYIRKNLLSAGLQGIEADENQS